MGLCQSSKGNDIVLHPRPILSFKIASLSEFSIVAYTFCPKYYISSFFLAVLNCHVQLID